MAGEDSELKSALDHFQKTILREQGIVRNAILAGVQRIDLGVGAVHADVKANLVMTDQLMHRTSAIVTGTDQVHTYIKSRVASFPLLFL